MRRSSYQNLRFPKGACPGMCMEPAPSHACSVRPCPSRMPGPAPLPLQSAELRKGGGPHHQPRGESLGEQRGWYAGLRGVNISVHWLGQRPGCNCMMPDACLAGSLEQTLLLATISRLGGLPMGGRSCSLLALRLKGWGSAGICPSAAREVVARWQEGLSVGLGPVSTAEEWTPAGKQGSIIAVQGVQGLSLLQGTKTQTSTRN